MQKLSTRLQKLEQATSDTAMSIDAERLLVQLLARRDAMFWPFRTHGSYRAEVRRLQREYLQGVGGLRAASQGETKWKSGHFTRNELTAAKLVSPQTAGGQVLGLRLTAQGVADARAMVGDRLQPLDSALTQGLLTVLRENGDWVRENDLFGDELTSGTDPNDWQHAVEYLLPLLSCGIVESNSDLWNRAYFRFVDGVNIPLEPPSTSQVRPWADGLYLSAFDAERSALERLEAEDGGIVIPIRCT